MAVASSQQVHHTFASIARRYDFFNGLFSAGIADYWRACLKKKVLKAEPKTILDLATGSGDVARMFSDQEVVGVDFCAPMLAEAKKKGLKNLVEADARALPFEDNRFDAITLAFGFRNFSERDQCLKEMHRVLRVGGWVWILEFYQPARWLRPFYYTYLFKVMPLIAEWVLGDGSAYRYLGESIRQFPSCEHIAEQMKQAGFSLVTYWKMTLGIVAIHAGQKTADTV